LGGLRYCRGVWKGGVELKKNKRTVRGKRKWRTRRSINEDLPQKGGRKQGKMRSELNTKDYVGNTGESCSHTTNRVSGEKNILRGLARGSR